MSYPRQGQLAWLRPVFGVLRRVAHEPEGDYNRLAIRYNSCAPTRRL